MINFTIKTLDSNNHQFSVDDDITVQQFKEKVRDQMGIDPDLQRLIFCGRVLQDEKKLSEYNVNGKVVHLVQRAPPSPESRQSAPSINNPDAMQQQIRRLMALSNPPESNAEQQQSLTMTSTTARLEFIRRMINEIRVSLAVLRSHIDGEDNAGAAASGEARPESAEHSEPAANAAQAAHTHDVYGPEVDDNGEEITDPVVRAQYLRRRALRALRGRQSRPRELGLLLEDLETLEEQFLPHRANYIRLLRATGDPEVSQITEDERRHTQRTVDLIADLMHSFSHAYHAVSDISFLVDQRNSRLISDPSPLRQPIPMQAHINLVQSNRRQQQQQQNANTNAGTGTSATSTQTSATTANSTDTSANSQGTQRGQATPQAGRNTTQPTVSINIHPDPVTYQVEIETRVPIAFPFENALFNGVTNAAPGNNQQSTDQTQQNQTGQQGQANRRQVLLDFENLFRGLGQAGGVEVVMSMEEIPQMGVMGPESGVTGNNVAPTLANLSAQQGEGGVFLAPMPWGGPPSADLLQNIVSSVIRQGLVPGMEGVALHFPQNLGSPFHTAFIPAQLPGAMTQQAQQGVGQPQAAPGTQPNQEQANQEPRQPPSLRLRRATTTTRAQALSLANMIYDRFLQCESLHARRHLQRRRDQYQLHLAAQERLNAERAAAQNIEFLRQRNANLSPQYIQTMRRLLNSDPSREAWFNAIMVTIARYLFLSEPMRAETETGEFAVVPHQIRPLRAQLRSFVHYILLRAEADEIGENDFQGAADYLVDQHSEFINRMYTIASLRPEVDILMSIRNLIRSRLPAIIESVMSEPRGEMYASRFYALFGRAFIDLCAVITYCCEEGVEGLERIYTTFLDAHVRTFERSAQQALVTVSLDNMHAILDTLPYNLDSIRPCIHLRDDASETPSSPDSPLQSSTPMDMSPQIPVREEPMQMSPHGSLYNTAEVSNILDLAFLEPLEAIAEDPCLTCPIHASTSFSRLPTNQQTNNAVDEPVSSSNRPPPRTPKTEKSETTTSNGDDNVRFVPPVVIIQHWGEEWVPVFTRDQQAQRADTQEPYSDAYLSGMPSRKRRCVRQARPPATLDGFINECVSEATDRSSPVDNSAIRVAFREHMRNMARNRASSSDDFDPLQYASAARFLNPPRPNKKQQPEKDTEHKDAA